MTAIANLTRTDLLAVFDGERELAIKLGQHGFVLCHRDWLEQSVPAWMTGGGCWTAHLVLPFEGPVPGLPENLREAACRLIDAYWAVYNSGPDLWWIELDPPPEESLQAST